MKAGGKTVLIVEDDKLNRDALSIFLKKKFTIETCDSANTFYKKLSTIRIDLIIMDISLNGKKNGLELTEEIRKHPEYNNIPVICLTAHVRKQDEINAFSAGADVFITKPANIKVILREINRFLGED